MARRSILQHKQMGGATTTGACCICPSLVPAAAPCTADVQHVCCQHATPICRQTHGVLRPGPGCHPAQPASKKSRISLRRTSSCWYRRFTAARSLRDSSEAHFSSLRSRGPRFKRRSSVGWAAAAAGRRPTGCAHRPRCRVPTCRCAPRTVPARSPAPCPPPRCEQGAGGAAEALAGAWELANGSLGYAVLSHCCRAPAHLQLSTTTPGRRPGGRSPGGSCIMVERRHLWRGCEPERAPHPS